MKSSMKKTATYVPVTPGGSLLFHFESRTEEIAWAKLMESDTRGLYKNKKDYIERGYTVEKT